MKSIIIRVCLLLLFPILSAFSNYTLGLTGEGPGFMEDFLDNWVSTGVVEELTKIIPAIIVF